MINGMNELGMEGAMIYHMYMSFPSQWLPLPVMQIPPEVVKANVDKLVAMNLLEVEKNEANEYFYRAHTKAEEVFLERPEMPSVYGRVLRIIREGDYTFVRKVFDTTPMVAKRWEKIEYITDPVLEELLQQMDAYLRTKRKRYKDLTLVLNNWAKKRGGNSSSPQQQMSEEW